MDRKYNKNIGKLGENYAVKYLEKNKYKILNRNYSFRGGEIDIIAERPDKSIRFIEVKTRLNESYGKITETISIHKKKFLKRSAYDYLMKENIINENIGLDFIGILMDKNLEMIKFEFIEDIN